MIDSYKAGLYITLIILSGVIVFFFRIRNFVLTAILLLLAILLAGCDTDSGKNVTGDFVYTEPRNLVTVTAPPDSFYTAVTFKEKMGLSSFTLAGRYRSIEAFSIYKFPVYNVRLDNIIGAYVTFDIQSVWNDGALSFDLYETVTDWADSASLDPDHFTTSLGQPLATYADTTSSPTSLSFTFDENTIKNWVDYGALLLKSSDTGGVMANVLSDDTQYPPVLYLIKDYGDGDIDTTSVNSNMGAYFLKTVAGDETLMSEGDASGYVMHFGMPSEIPVFATINKCVLSVTALDPIFPEEPYTIGFYRLKEPFETIETASLDTSNGVTVSLYEDSPTKEVDLAEIVNEWQIGGNPNYGIVIKSVNPGESPNQCRLAVLDSLKITYTAFPPVK